MKIAPLSLTSTQQSEFEDLSVSLKTASGYKWLASSEIPTAVPDSLRRKLTSALLMWERTGSGVTQIVCNGIRLDDKANALDQEPFGVAVYSSGVSTGGLFLHHGNWTGRTETIAPEIQSVLDSTSLGNYFPLGQVPPKSSGPLSDLSQTSHEGAFRATISHLLPRGA